MSRLAFVINHITPDRRARLFDDGPAGSSLSLTDMAATGSGTVCLLCDRAWPA